MRKREKKREEDDKKENGWEGNGGKSTKVSKYKNIATYNINIKM